jgi:hypothetical protein
MRRAAQVTVADEIDSKASDGYEQRTSSTIRRTSRQLSRVVRFGRGHNHRAAFETQPRRNRCLQNVLRAARKALIFLEPLLDVWRQSNITPRFLPISLIHETWLKTNISETLRLGRPRGILRQMKLSWPLTGNVLGRFAAPEITPARLVARGLTTAGLVSFLATRPRAAELRTWRYAPGDRAQHAAPRGNGGGGNGDLSAWRPSAASGVLARRSSRGGAPARPHDLSCCLRACHGLDGEGEPNTVVVLRGKSMLRLDDPRN